ncbi:MAG TPA: NosD domain-containing protein [Acidimicrobiales bacterium]|nr:NosD domain-containing protein [Acidimicrobiales bacterium]
MSPIRRTTVNLVVLATLSTGFLLSTPGVASAKGNNLFVTPTGTGAACLRAKPCGSIAAALAVATPGATVHVAPGTYTEQDTIANARDDDVTILGSGATKSVVQPPASGLLSAADTDTSNPQYYALDVGPGIKASIKDLGINGTSASAFFDADGAGCSQDFDGIYVHDSTVKLTSVQVTGIDLPPDLAACAGGRGIYVASDSGSNASLTSTGVLMPTASGASFSGPTFPAYDTVGIACDDPGTSCSITSGKIQGMGSTNVVTQYGIQILGASGLVNGASVSNNSYSAGGAGLEAAGVRAINASSLNIEHTASLANDIDIDVAVIPSDGLMPPTIGPWTISDNTAESATDDVSAGENGYGEGIQVDSNTNSVTVEGNNASYDTQAGLYLIGATSVTLESNTANKNEVGIYVGGPGSAVGPSTSNVISHNTLEKDTAGVIVDGAFDPAPPTGNGPNPDSASGNVFSANTWTLNLVNAADFSGWAGTSPVSMLDTWGSPTSDKCEPTPGGSSALDSAVGNSDLYAC